MSARGESLSGGGRCRGDRVCGGELFEFCESDVGSLGLEAHAPVPLTLGLNRRSAASSPDLGSARPEVPPRGLGIRARREGGRKQNKLFQNTTNCGGLSCPKAKRWSSW